MPKSGIIAVPDKSYFPLLIELNEKDPTGNNNRRIIVYHPSDLPNGEPFKVLETNCNIEIRFRYSNVGN
jgi:hypothetical protein